MKNRYRAAGSLLSGRKIDIMALDSLPDRGRSHIVKRQFAIDNITKNRYTVNAMIMLRETAFLYL